MLHIKRIDEMSNMQLEMVKKAFAPYPEFKVVEPYDDDCIAAIETNYYFDEFFYGEMHDIEDPYMEIYCPTRNTFTVIIGCSDYDRNKECRLSGAEFSDDELAESYTSLDDLARDLNDFFKSR